MDNTGQRWMIFFKKRRKSGVFRHPGVLLERGLVPPAGVEPAAYRLQGGRSTN